MQVEAATSSPLDQLIATLQDKTKFEKLLHSYRKENKGYQQQASQFRSYLKLLCDADSNIFSQPVKVLLAAVNRESSEVFQALYENGLRITYPQLLEFMLAYRAEDKANFEWAFTVKSKSTRFSHLAEMVVGEPNDFEGEKIFKLLILCGGYPGIQWLVKSGIKFDPNHIDEQEYSFLMYAIAKQSISRYREDIIKFLVQVCGVDINYTDRHGGCGLLSALFAFDQQTLELLLSQPSLKVKEMTLRNILHFCTDQDACNKNSNTWKKEVTMVIGALLGGQMISEQDKARVRATLQSQLAVPGNQSQVDRYITLYRGVSIKTRHEKESKLVGVLKNYREHFKSLSKYSWLKPSERLQGVKEFNQYLQAQVRSGLTLKQSKLSESILNAALKRFEPDVLEALYEQGLRVSTVFGCQVIENHIDEHTSSCLFQSPTTKGYFEGRLNCMPVLFKICGLDKDPKVLQQLLAIAAQHAKCDFMTFLHDNYPCVNLNCVNEAKQTALMVLIKNKPVGLSGELYSEAEQLIERKIDLNIQDAQGRSALSMAMQANNLSLCRLLLDQPSLTFNQSQLEGLLQWIPVKNAQGFDIWNQATCYVLAMLIQSDKLTPQQVYQLKSKLSEELHWSINRFNVEKWKQHATSSASIEQLSNLIRSKHCKFSTFKQAVLDAIKKHPKLNFNTPDHLGELLLDIAVRRNDVACYKFLLEQAQASVNARGYEWDRQGKLKPSMPPWMLAGMGNNQAFSMDIVYYALSRPELDLSVRTNGKSPLDVSAITRQREPFLYAILATHLERNIPIPLHIVGFRRSPSDNRIDIARALHCHNDLYPKIAHINALIKWKLAHKGEPLPADKIAQLPGEVVLAINKIRAHQAELKPMQHPGIAAPAMQKDLAPKTQTWDKEKLKNLSDALIQRRLGVVAQMLHHDPTLIDAPLDYTGKNLLMQAVADEYTEAVHYLVSLSDPGFMDNKGQTPLMMALRFNRLQYLPLLQKHGHNVNLQYKNGNTALMLGPHSPKGDIIKAGLGLGANLELINNEGENLLRCYTKCALPQQNLWPILMQYINQHRRIPGPWNYCSSFHKTHAVLIKIVAEVIKKTSSVAQCKQVLQKLGAEKAALKQFLLKKCEDPSYQHALFSQYIDVQEVSWQTRNNIFDYSSRIPLLWLMNEKSLSIPCKYFIDDVIELFSGLANYMEAENELQNSNNDKAVQQDPAEARILPKFHLYHAVSYLGIHHGSRGFKAKAGTEHAYKHDITCSAVTIDFGDRRYLLSSNFLFYILNEKSLGFSWRPPQDFIDRLNRGYKPQPGDNAAKPIKRSMSTLYKIGYLVQDEGLIYDTHGGHNNFRAGFATLADTRDSLAITPQQAEILKQAMQALEEPQQVYEIALPYLQPSPQNQIAINPPDGMVVFREVADAKVAGTQAAVHDFDADIKIDTDSVVASRCQP